jgi:hypothetical protein
MNTKRIVLTVTLALLLAGVFSLAVPSQSAYAQGPRPDPQYCALNPWNADCVKDAAKGTWEVSKWFAREIGEVLREDFDNPCFVSPWKCK